MHTSSCDIIAETPISTVYRVQSTDPAGQPRAVKVCNSDTSFTPEPHDIRKEIRILSQLSHPNVIGFLGHELDDTSYRLWMPYISYSLKSLLECPSFAPSPHCGGGVDDESRFIVLAKSIFHQTLQALEYLHHPTRLIAHRDIKPGNILLTAECQVKLIDFGISWEGHSGVEGGDIWNESPEKMYTEVASGPYRAPELLFGPKSYDAIATDKWSLGCTLADFFTPLRLIGPDAGEDGDEDDGSESSQEDIRTSAFIIPKGLSPTQGTFWERGSLFNADRGDIGLAWSIFKLRGTPNQENWPTFKELPYSTRVTFVTVPAVDLHRVLPNLPSNLRSPGSTASPGFPDQHLQSSPVDLITQLLAYPPASRLSCELALKHPWFSQEDIPLLLPAASSVATGEVWKGQQLRDLLHNVLKSVVL